MNLGRFHSAVYAIKKEMEEGSTIQVLANLQSNLQNSISQQTAESVAITSTAASIAWDAADIQVATHTATEDTTLANPTNLVAGTTYIFIWTQHASAPKTLAFGSAFKWSGAAPTVTATNGAVDIFSFITDGTNVYGTFVGDFS